MIESQRARECSHEYTTGETTSFEPRDEPAGKARRSEWPNFPAQRGPCGGANIAGIQSGQIPSTGLRALV